VEGLEKKNESSPKRSPRPMFRRTGCRSSFKGDANCVFKDERCLRCFVIARIPSLIR
jgi:hypothetical protein